MTKKIYGKEKTKMTLEVSKSFNTRRKLLRHILHSFKPNNFRIEQFFIGRTI